jgi:hypothetical protein
MIVNSQPDPFSGYMFQLRPSLSGYDDPRQGACAYSSYENYAKGIETRCTLFEEPSQRNLAQKFAKAEMKTNKPSDEYLAEVEIDHKKGHYLASQANLDHSRRENEERQIPRNIIEKGLKLGIKGLTNAFQTLNKFDNSSAKLIANSALSSFNSSNPPHLSKQNYRLETNLFEETMKLGLPELAFERLGAYVSYLNNPVNYQENSSPAFTDTPAKVLHPITAHAYFAGEKVQELLLDLFKTLVKTEVAPSLFAKPLDSQANIIDRDLKMTASLFNAFNPENPQYQEAKDLIEKKLINLFKQGAEHGISAQALVALSSASSVLIPGTQKTVELVNPEFLHTHIKDAVQAYLNKSEADNSFRNKINLPSEQRIAEQKALDELINKRHYNGQVLTEIHPEDFKKLKKQLEYQAIQQNLKSMLNLS